MLDLSAESFAKVIDAAFGKPLSPPFDPYASGIHYLIASYLVPYVGLTGYVGASSRLEGSTSKRVPYTIIPLSPMAKFNECTTIISVC